MGRLRALVVVASTAGCAQVLGYDDYRARGVDASIADTAEPIDTFVPEEEVAVDSGPPPFRPPARPAGDAKPSGAGKTLWLAVRTYRLGSVDPDGGKDEDAWRVHGYDLDAVCTGPRESDENIGTCQRPMGAFQDSLIDGERCRDNNFGRHIGTIIRVSAPDSERMLNDAVALGSSTWVLRLDDVDASTDDAYAPGALYRTNDVRTSGVTLKWDGTDQRTALSDSVMDGDPLRAVVAFPRGFIAGGVWVSGEPSPIKLSLPVTASTFITMNLEHGVITLELDPARTTGGKGIVAGVVRGGDLEGLLKPIADNAGVCPGSSIYETMLRQTARMPDVVVGAPGLQDTTRTCDGVSAGMSFEVAPIRPITDLAPPPPPRAPRCGDAG